MPPGRHRPGARTWSWRRWPRAAPRRKPASAEAIACSPGRSRARPADAAPSASRSRSPRSKSNRVRVGGSFSTGNTRGSRGLGRWLRETGSSRRGRSSQLLVSSNTRRAARGVRRRPQAVRRTRRREGKHWRAPFRPKADGARPAGRCSRPAPTTRVAAMARGAARLRQGARDRPRRGVARGGGEGLGGARRGRARREGPAAGGGGVPPRAGRSARSWRRAARPRPRHGPGPAGQRGFPARQPRRRRGPLDALAAHPGAGGPRQPSRRQLPHRPGRDRQPARRPRRWPPHTSSGRWPSAKALAPGSLEHAQVLGNLGFVRREQGDLAGAEEFYRRSLEILRDDGARKAPRRGPP